MLVLSRKREEQIVIGENVEITVVAIQPGRVKLGICAPEDIRILRQELSERDLDPAKTTTAVGRHRPK